MAEYAKDWLAAVQPTIRPSTFSSYRLVIDNYVVPRLGTVRLSGLYAGPAGPVLRRPGRREGRPGGALSPTTVRCAHTVLGKALGDAVGVGARRTQRGPDGQTPRGRRRRSCGCGRPRRAWSIFVVLMRNDRLYALWFLLLTTGMRRGEAAGLRRSDIDLAAGVLSIRRAIVSVDGMAIQTAPKSANRRRTIALDPRDHRCSAATSGPSGRRAGAGRGWAGLSRGAVFTYPDGAVLHPDHVMVVFRRLRPAPVCR